MANGNSLENTAVVENLNDEETLDNVEQQGEGDIELLESLGFNSEEKFLFNKEIPKQANIYIDDKLIQGGYKAIQGQIDVGAYSENIKTVDNYVKAFGDRARVEPGRNLFGKLITEEKATIVDEPRVEDSFSEWALKYDKNLKVDSFKFEYEKYQNNLNLNEEQESELDVILNPDNKNYNPDLFTPYEANLSSGSLTGYIPMGTMTRTIQPNEEVLNEAKKYLESRPRFINKKTGKKSPINRDQIEKVARIIMANKKEEGFFDSNAKTYLDDLDPDLRKSLFDYKINDYIKGTYIDTEFLDDQEKKILDLNNSILNSTDYKNYNNLSSAYKNLNTELIDLKNQIDQIDKSTLDGDLSNSYEALVINFNNKLTTYQEIYKGVQDSAEGLNVKVFEIDKKVQEFEKNIKIAENQDDLKRELDYLKRDYSQFNKIFGVPGSREPGTFAVGFAKAGIDILTFVDFQLFNHDKIGLIPGFDPQEASQVIREYEDRQRPKFSKPIKFENAFDSVSNFGEFMVDQSVQQSSFLYAMSISPYLTIGLSGGGYIADRQKEADTFGGRSYTDGEIAAKSIAFGAAEYIFGTAPTMGILRRGRLRLNNTSQRELVQGYKNRFDYLLKNSPVLAYDVGIESSTEGLTTVFQNGIDGKPLIQGVDESLFVGGMFGFAFSGAPTLYGALLNNFSDYNKYQGFRNNLDMIGRLKRNNLSSFVSEKDKQQNLKTIKKLELENSESLNELDNNVNEELTSEGLGLVLEATIRQEQLRIEAEEIINNKSLPKDIREKSLKPLKIDFDQLQTAIDAFKQSFTKMFPLLDKKERSRLSDLAIKNLKSRGAVSPSEQAILQEAEYIYNSESIDKNVKNDLKIINNLGEAGININYNLSDSNNQIIKDYKEILDGHVANADVDLTQAQADAKFNRFKEGIENGTINGINEAVLDNKSGKNIYNVLVSRQNSVANNKQHTGVHEIGHTIFTEAFASNPNAFVDLSNIILEYTKKVNPEAYTRIATRTAGQNADEVLTNFLEEVANNNIDFNKAKKTGFLGPIGRILGLGVSSVAGSDYSFNFKGETDVANFLTNLAKKLKTGDLSVKDIRTIKQEGIAGRKIDDPTSVETKESLTPSQQQLKQSFTNEQLLRKRKNSKGKELADIDNILIEGGARIGLRAMGFDTRKGLGNISYNDALQTARTRIAERGLLDKFDAKINNNWSTYVGSNLRFDIKDVIQQNQISIDAASIDTEKAKQIVDPTTIDIDEAVDVKEKRKINVLKGFDGVTESDVINIVKVKEGDTYADISNNYTGVVGNNIFNIPQDKVVVGSKNLTYAKKIVNGIPETSEAGNIQDWIRKGQNALNFIKILPKQSVTSDTADTNELGENIDVDRNILGLAIGIKGKFQNYFYNKTNKRSKGKKSQPFIWELKPEFVNPTPEVVEKFKTDVGITEAGQLNNYNRDIGQLLKGVAKIYSQQASFSAAQRNLAPEVKKAEKVVEDAQKVLQEAKGEKDIEAKRKALKKAKDNLAQSKKRIANITAAQSKTAFSETDVKKIIDNFNKNSNATRIHNVITVGTIAKSRLQESIDLNFVPGKTYTNETKKLYNRNKMLPKDVASFEGETVIQGMSRITNNFLDKYPQYEQFLNKSFTFGIDRSPFGVKEVWDKNIIKRGSKNQASYKKNNYSIGRIIKNSFIENTKKSDYVSEELQKLEDLISFIEDFNSFLNKETKLEDKTIVKPNSKDSWYLDEFAMAAQNSMTAPARANAPVLVYEIINGNKNKPFKGKGIEEHFDPQNEIITSLVGAAKDGNLKQISDIIRLSYMQGFVSDLNNDLVNEEFSDTKPDLYYSGLKLVLNGDLKLDAGLLSVARYAESGVDLNNLYYIPTKQTIGEYFFNTNNLPVKNQKELIKDLFEGKLTLKNLRDYGNTYSNIGKLTVKTFKFNLNKNNNSKFSKSNTNEGLLNDLNNHDKALRNARNLNAPIKGISIFDFDDTVATSDSKVIVQMPDGSVKQITPAEFAKQHGSLEQQDAAFDFSEFNKVIDGKPGPLAVKIKKQIQKFGSKDVYILTARPQTSATSIKAFLDGIGINIPLKNITGLEDGSPDAKANWVRGKAGEGYNDFYFTDDVYKNVKAVQDVLEVLDVKSKTRLAYSDRIKKLDRDFNDIIEAKTGIAAEKEYGRTKAEVVGANKGKFNFFIPPSAEDFVGLLYNTLSKGKLGDSQMAWYKKNLLDPYASAMSAISRERISLMEDYKTLKKQLGFVPKNLNKKIPGDIYTNEQAVRVYIWNKQGMTIPGLSQADLKELTKYVDSKPELKLFGDQLININKDDGYAAPISNWLGGTITTDMMRGLGTTKRAKHLQQWQQNADIIFSEKNLNKLEAANGKAYRDALENILQRMKTGRNRGFTSDSKTGKFVDWLTNSIGTIMFFNTRSALLQTISAVNFVNFTDNNMFKAGKAYANQKQFWSDFMELMNSEFLIDRRRGLRINVNEADIANMANEGGARGVVAKMLEIGFLPTQIADSFAIASGGATFYRNRINTYKKQGLSDKEAQEKAFKDFREIAEESQQSSRPDRISQEQAGPLGRIILAFANTPMQYARLIKKAASDLKNRRGDVKTNISKIIYYGFVQNLIFNALQQAIFAIGFGDVDEEDEKDKYVNTANNMLDSLLRGSGLTGAYFSVGKNIVMRVVKESQKDNPKYEKASFDLARLSPPISSKLSRINQAGRAFQWQKKEMIEKGFAIDNPALMASANVISAATNIPVDRLVRKANNVNTAISQDLELWERFALLGGWQDWEIGVEESDKKKGKKTFGSFKNTELKKLKPLKTKLKTFKIKN